MPIGIFEKNTKMRDKELLMRTAKDDAGKTKPEELLKNTQIGQR